MSWWNPLFRRRPADQDGPAGSTVRSPGLAITLGLSAAVIGLLLAAPRVLHQTPSYEVGQFTDRAIRAPFDFSVEDAVATARKRQEAARSSPPVAVLDRGTAARITERLATAFAEARSAHAATDAPVSDATAAAHLLAVQDRIGLELGPPEGKLLTERAYDSEIEGVLLDLIRSAYDHPVAADAVRLRRLAEEAADPSGPRVIVRQSDGQEQVAGNLAQFDDLDSARQRLRRAPDGLAPELAGQRATLAGLASRLLTPNLVYDAQLTEARRASASAAVLPVVLSFRRNQLIIGEGQEVSREARLVLDELQSRDQPGTLVPRWLAASVLAFLFLYVAIWPARRTPADRQRLARRHSTLSMAGVLATVVGFWLWLFVVDILGSQVPGVSRVGLTLLFPIPASAMLVALVANRRDGLAHLVVTSIIAGLLSDLGAILALQSMVGGLVGVTRVAGCSRRGCVVRAGLAAGAVGTIGAASVLAFSDGPVTAGHVASVLAGALLGGTSSGLAVVALSSVVESLFGYSTNIRLVELLSYEHPLLRRLAAEAPGTFQHCVSVAVLGSAAADAIGAHALLVRVGTLYHDVGKLERPAFFTENQRGLNPHDQLDPEESARLIRAHVTDGLTLIRAHGIGEQIADFVREHHGTGTMACFAKQAEAQGASADPSVFRYPGPRPRSRETAILMLVDQIEATARSMTDATEADYDAMVLRTIDRIRNEGQLDEAPLTLGDLRRIRQALVATLVGSNHRRVAYPQSP